MQNFILLLLSFLLCASMLVLVRPSNIWMAIVVRLVLAWVLFYGCVFPVAAILSPASPVLLYKEYYGVASLLLAVFALIFVVSAFIVFGRHNYAVGLSISPGIADVSVILSIITFVAFYWSEKYQRDVHSMLVLPSLMVAYAVHSRSNGAWIRILGFHVLFLFVGALDGFLLDSKERIVTSVLLPFLSFVLFSVKSKSVKISMLISALLIGVLLLVIASGVVRETRAQGEVAQVEVFSEDRFLSVIERLAVVDALSSAVHNEQKLNPMRPSQPWWSLLGFVGQVGPAFFERPNHAREALLLTGYLTSTDDVNIALTVPGHFLWSLGWLGAFVGVCIFWVSVLYMLKISSLMHPLPAAMFFFFFISQVPRLESVGYAFVASLFTALGLYGVLWVLVSYFSPKVNFNSV